MTSTQTLTLTVAGSTTTIRNSAQWTALRMLAYIGVTSLDPKPDTGADPDDNKTYLAAGDLDAIAGIQSAALQDIFADGPAALSNVNTGAALFGPATIILNVTQGSAAALCTGGWLPWMNGCSCLIAGDGFVNELGNVDAGGVLTLRRPYLGTTAAGVSATVFGSSIVLDPGIKNVLEPVNVGGRMLTPCPDRATFNHLSGCGHHSGAVISGWPAYFFVETRYDPALDDVPVILRVAPAPQGALPITFTAKLNPPIITTADLGSSNADPGRMLPIPGHWMESIFLAYCLQRFTGYPLFKNDGAKAEIARAFAAAKTKLAGFKPQIARSGPSYAFPP